MRTIRIFFTKTGEASYISHLDLQRVMARALRRSGLPVWYSQGFNPHIYLSFALPLPLMQESVVESMDCKTESEVEDFSSYLVPLNEALPKGIAATKIAFPAHLAGAVQFAEYSIFYPKNASLLQECAGRYAALANAIVTRKTKRSSQEMDLKALLPCLPVQEGAQPCLQVRLPAGSPLNINPTLLTEFLEREFGLPAVQARILRTNVLLENGEVFC